MIIFYAGIRNVLNYFVNIPDMCHNLITTVKDKGNFAEVVNIFFNFSQILSYPKDLILIIQRISRNCDSCGLLKKKKLVQCTQQI